MSTAAHSMNLSFKPLRNWRTVLTWLVLALIAAASYFAETRDAAIATGQQGPVSVPGLTAADMDVVARAYANRRSGLWLTTSGVISRVLPDDNDGARHQRFILVLPSKHRVLIAHNIDLAERIPAEEGDPIRLRGRYEWNEKGGVIHWTHHDPVGRQAGGWIEAANRRYR